MTHPLYHGDPARLNFAATVTAVQEKRVALDATAFYPGGGGQNADAGLLRWDGGEARVTDTQKDRASGLIWHTLEGALPPVGTSVTGEVDAPRRWRQMARHSGEHLLAQAFFRLDPAFRVAAVGMRGPDCTLDLEGFPTGADAQAAEELLRDMLARHDLTLETRVVPEAEVPRYPLRRPPQVRGQVRLVMFRDEAGVPFDVSACGGVHVPHAGMAAPVVVLRTERIRSGLTRVVFRAGEEAAGFLTGTYRDARALAQGFSVGVPDLPARVAALTAERDALKVEAAALRIRLAAALVAATPAGEVAGIPLRTLTLDDPALLQGVLAATPPGEVGAAVTPDGRCGIGSGRSELPAGSLLAGVLKVTGGQGGGRPDLAQGTTANPAAFLDAVRRLLATRETAAPGDSPPGSGLTPP
ncbi:alanine--tRNA ligase-related protein [Deinococcus sp. MIMF12]|uniref:Alanine--tRNA ligase-related protein n=1 Tax=Deinococcus rhizophilus TaxID=3049544 RepID=A0ABT7JDT6_9DEIO|nr:alanine--tRNA ligase-related protein [Deinococcus rhizophilus]MDL2343212.1 alanine--tRNA ligase-related protein [Deinococcus rhizophilus]